MPHVEEIDLARIGIEREQRKELPQVGSPARGPRDFQIDPLGPRTGICQGLRKHQRIDAAAGLARRARGAGRANRPTRRGALLPRRSAFGRRARRAARESPPFPPTAPGPSARRNPRRAGRPPRGRLRRCDTAAACRRAPPGGLWLERPARPSASRRRASSPAARGRSSRTFLPRSSLSIGSNPATPAWASAGIKRHTNSHQSPSAGRASFFSRSSIAGSRSASSAYSTMATEAKSLSEASHR